jgi:hypothetical protein
MSDVVHNPKLPRGDYERRDIRAADVIYFLIGLAIAVVFAYLIAKGVFRYLDKHYETGQPPVSPLVNAAPSDTRRIPPQFGNNYEKYLQQDFPAPQLEINERTELNDIRLREEDTLSTYGWVDQKSGAVRIPIDRAMDLLVERGLPLHSQPDEAGQNLKARPEKMEGNRQ